MIKRLLILSLACLALAACQTVPAPAPAITLTGFLTPGSPVEETITGPLVEHHWVFTGEADQAFEVLFQAEDSLPTLTVRGPDGTILREVRSQAYQNTMALSFILPAAGNHAIVIGMPGAGESAYHLVLQVPGALPTPPPPTASLTPAATAAIIEFAATPLPLDTLPTPDSPTAPPRVGSGTRLTSHQPITGMLADSGSEERYTIVGSAGDIISISASTAPGSRVNPYLTLYAPSGETLAEAHNSFGTQDAILTGLELPATGAYIVFVRDSAGTATGQYELAFGFGLTTRRQVQIAPLPDAPVSGLLNQPAIQDAWPLALNLGDIISVAVVVDDASGLDPIVQLVAPDGQIMYTDDNSGGGRSAALRQVIAPASGVFYLTVSPARQDSFGPYTLIWRYDAIAPVPAN